jgi:hypothetical protein
MASLHDQSISASPPPDVPPAAGVAGDSIPLSNPPGPAPEAPGTAPGPLDSILLVLLAVLAFLLASFPARNSDVWLHLAAGRTWTAAFPHSTEGNSTWLFDVACYTIYSSFGGTGLVVAKALIVVALALVLLRLCRAGRGWFLATVCTALAILGVSTRLRVQPETVSCLFLALALWCARRRGAAAEVRLPPLLPPWSLGLLFVLWANMDSWFVLGIATVALVWLGRSLDDNATSAARLTALVRHAVSLAILATVCLLNPAHFHAFTLPPEVRAIFAAAGTPIRPFQGAYLSSLGWTPVGVAYYVLLALGAVSFALNLPRPRWEHLLPWVALAVLSALQARAVPFFAVVAGPVLAWNLQSWLERRAPQGSTVPPPRVLGVLLGLVLVVCAWPGWLQAPPYEPRSWSLDVPRPLELAAAATRRWHQQQRLTAQTCGLHLSPETVAFFSWFCPEDRAVADPDLAAAFRGEREGPADGAERMRAAGVNHIVLSDADRSRFHATLERLLAYPLAQEFPLLYLEGNVAIFGWRDSAAGRRGDPFQDWQLDFNELAFNPAKEKQAPRKAPERQPEARQWWDEFTRPLQPRPPEADEAAAYLMYAEAIRRSAPVRLMLTWDFSQSAAAVGTARGTGYGGPAAALLDNYMSLVRLQAIPPDAEPAAGTAMAANREVWEWQKLFTLQQDDAPPALLYIAIRAARRALAVNPDDAQAYLILGESYLRLGRSTRERAWVGRLPNLTQLRLSQASTALNRAVTLKPELAQAHLRLADVYRGLGHLDLALDHLQTYVKLIRQAPLPKGDAAAAAREQQAQLQEEATRLAREVEDRENSYGAASVGQSVLDRATMASQRGLARKARDMLLESDISAFGRGGMELEVKLMVSTGQAQEVLAALNAEDREAHIQTVGPVTYHWLRIQALAALGEYEKLQDECDQLGKASIPVGPDGAPLPVRQALLSMVGKMVLDEWSQEGPVSYLARRTGAQAETLRKLPMLARALTQEADLNVLRGLFLLEEGRVIEAKAAFQAARDLWSSDAAVASGRGLDFSGRPIAQDCLEWLASGGR